MQNPNFPPIPKGGRILNPFAPEKITIKIEVNAQTGEARMGTDTILPPTSVIAIFAALTQKLAGDLEKELTVNLQSDVLKKQGEQLANGNKDDNNKGNKGR